MANKHAHLVKLDRDQNPFDSPGLSVNSIPDTESGNTSGQDEFHLERYGQGLNRETSSQHKPARQLSKHVREPSPRKRPRPGLNIVTDFSKPIARRLADGVMVDQVKAHHPEVGQRPMPTVRSHRVEHFRSDAQPLQSEGPTFVKLSDLGLQKKEKQGSRPKAVTKSKTPGILLKSMEGPPPAYSSKNPDYPTQSRSIQSSDPYQQRRKGDSRPDR